MRVLAGGCSCGFVRYEAHGPAWRRTLCHCASCRRASGAPAVAWLTLRRDGFRLVAGAPTEHRSSAQVTRAFCPRCGTPLTFAHDGLPGEIDVTACSLDDPEAAAPQDHTWTGRRLSWLVLADGLPTYVGARIDP